VAQQIHLLRHNFANVEQPDDKQYLPSAQPVLVHKMLRAPLRLLVWPARSFSSAKPTVSYDELKKLVEKAPEDLRIIDVREPHEYSAGAIPTAVNVPCACALRKSFCSVSLNINFMKRYTGGALYHLCNCRLYILLLE
jgi:hypothetical protein